MSWVRARDCSCQERPGWGASRSDVLLWKAFTVLLLSSPEFASLPFSWLSFLCQPRCGLMEQVTVRGCWAWRGWAWGKCREAGTGFWFWYEETPKQSLTTEVETWSEKRWKACSSLTSASLTTSRLVYDAYSFIVICSCRWNLLWTQSL